MKNNIDVIICTNKRLLGLKKLIHQILNQKGFFNFRIRLQKSLVSTKFKPQSNYTVITVNEQFAF